MVRGNSAETPCIVQIEECVILFFALVWVYVCFLIKTLFFSPLKEITVFLSGQSLHCRRTCQVALDIFGSLIDFKYGSRTINATNDPEFMKYKSVLNVVSDGYIVGIAKMSTTYPYTKHLKNHTLRFNLCTSQETNPAQFIANPVGNNPLWQKTPVKGAVSYRFSQGLLTLMCNNSELKADINFFFFLLRRQTS